MRKLFQVKEVRSTYPVQSARRKKRVYPIILNAGRTRACHTCSGFAISRSRRFERSERRFSWRRPGPHPQRNLIEYLCQGAYQRLPLNGSPEWRRRDGGVASTSSARLGGILGRLPDRPNFLGKPRRKRIAPSTFSPTAAPREISRRNLGLRSYLHTFVSFSLASLRIHMYSHAQRRSSEHSHVAHTSCPGSRLFGR